MESYFVRLKPLYQFISDNPTAAGLTPGSRERREYRLAVRGVTAPVPEAKGFYLWGRFEANGLWRNLYLGKAGYGRTSSLRARLTEELHDEAACLWIHRLRLTDLREGCPSRYRTHFDRSLRKAGTSHIVWVAYPELPDAAVTDVEADLIETLSPRANLARPVPPSAPQDHTHKVIRLFRQRIHEARTDDFRVADYFLEQAANGF